ncbi:28S ribosomal protein S22, mitochondrial-like isoform X2 [Pomacea canaliculata]|uniref:28S ribosomal protein S22, mitochondrial-like isoform X2 n=1 Tax=Pomacea canaliculata TaxID=400727 RepID=UPI000D73888A|nr:28S ribosomal protein S22, mitochondrial-like isoform X2 [Pomacea canaliculata]
MFLQESGSVSHSPIHQGDSTHNPLQSKAVCDPLPVFMHAEVQSLLHAITGFDLQRVARTKKMEIKKPQYKLLTDEELSSMVTRAQKRLQSRLQMPPFMKSRQPVRHVLSQDRDLEGLETHKHVFTDISSGIKDRHRIIVVRETDGTLREADWHERDRINQIYNPLPGRELRTPLMFSPQYLEDLLASGKFEYVLDAACVQFEPDDPEYIRVTHRTIEVIDSTHRYEELRCTRHFGPLAFYLVWYKKADFLLIDMLQRQLWSDAGDLVRLYTIVHPDSPAQLMNLPHENPLDVVKAFCDVEAHHKGQLQLALQAAEEAHKRWKSTLPIDVGTSVHD